MLFDRLRTQLRTARWHASDQAWHRGWRAIRAVTTPWARPHYEALRTKLGGRRRDVTLDNRFSRSQSGLQQSIL